VSSDLLQPCPMIPEMTTETCTTTIGEAEVGTNHHRHQVDRPMMTEVDLAVGEEEGVVAVVVGIQDLPPRHLTHLPGNLLEVGLAAAVIAIITETHHHQDLGLVLEPQVGGRRPAATKDLIHL